MAIIPCDYNVSNILNSVFFIILYICQHHVYQEPHFGVLHLPSGVLCMSSCTSGTSLGCTTLAVSQTFRYRALLCVLYLLLVLMSLIM